MPAHEHRYTLPDATPPDPCEGPPQCPEYDRCAYCRLACEAFFRYTIDGYSRKAARGKPNKRLMRKADEGRRDVGTAGMGVSERTLRKIRAQMNAEAAAMQHDRDRAACEGAEEVTSEGKEVRGEMLK